MKAIGVRVKVGGSGLNTTAHDINQIESFRHGSCFSPARVSQFKLSLSKACVWNARREGSGKEVCLNKYKETMDGGEGYVSPKS